MTEPFTVAGKGNACTVPILVYGKRFQLDCYRLQDRTVKVVVREYEDLTGLSAEPDYRVMVI